MKRIVCTLLAFVMLLSLSSVALASDLGVQVIGGPETEPQAISLDDLQLGKTYTIDGYATIVPVDAQFVDYFAQFSSNADYQDSSWTYPTNNDADAYVYYQEDALKGYGSSYYRQAGWMDSGLNADFFWFRCDITNLQKKTVQYLGEASVKIVYDDEYEFNGWIRQANFDYNTAVYRYNTTTSGAPFAVLDPANEEGIDMMYTGTFIFGCTLPNSVVESKAPLRIEITLGSNELTYNIRK